MVLVCSVMALYISKLRPENRRMRAELELGKTAQADLASIDTLLEIVQATVVQLHDVIKATRKL